jgi:hypothetical protein
MKSGNYISALHFSEEPEIIKVCGEYGGKIANQLTMQIAKQILL